MPPRRRPVLSVLRVTAPDPLAGTLYELQVRAAGETYTMDAYLLLQLPGHRQGEADGLTYHVLVLRQEVEDDEGEWAEAIVASAALDVVTNTLRPVTTPGLRDAHAPELAAVWDRYQQECPGALALARLITWTAITRVPAQTPGASEVSPARRAELEAAIRADRSAHALLLAAMERTDRLWVLRTLAHVGLGAPAPARSPRAV